MLQLASSVTDAATSGVEMPRREKLRGLVATILASKGRQAVFADDDALSELGVASFDMVTLLLSVEGAFGLEIPPHEITPDAFRSVAAIEGLLQRLAPQELAA